MYLAAYLGMLSVDAAGAEEERFQDSAKKEIRVLESLTPEEAALLEAGHLAADATVHRIANATCLSAQECRYALDSFVHWRDIDVADKERAAAARASFDFNQYTRNLEAEMARRPPTGVVMVDLLGLTSTQRQAVKDFIHSRFTKEERQWMFFTT